MIKINYWIFQKEPKKDINHVSTVVWYKRWFCKHFFTNEVYHEYGRDICYQWCDHCDQWIRKSYPRGVSKMLNHMATGKYE